MIILSERDAKDFIWNNKLIIKERQVKLKDLFRSSVIKWWIGTDALTLVKYPPGSLTWHIRIFFRRIWYKFIHRYVEHWAVSESIGKELELFGIKNYKIVQDAPLHIQKSNRPNVLYYYPKKKCMKFVDWVYGKDIFDIVGKYVDANWVIVDGNQNMEWIYKAIDGYIRPNRHDGMPRIILECEAMKIPYYWSSDFEPKVNDIIEFIETL